ncbi:MAG: energy transducer TonB [Terracidiphilus sp.]
MRPPGVIGLLAAMLACVAGWQQPVAPTAPPPSAEAKWVPGKVYSPGHDVTAPELLPFNAQLTPPTNCDEELDGKVKVSLLVDETGQPRNVMFVNPLANDLDRFALQIAEADRFRPGTHNGTPVVVGQSLEVGIKSCVVEKDDSTGKKSYSLQMRSFPEQKLRPFAEAQEKAVSLPSRNPAKFRISAPIPLNTVEAQYTPEAKKAKINGVCLVSVIVDAHGMPQNPRVMKGLDPGLDQNALIAVGKYRFKPAIKDGTPVPVMITIEVNFRLY